MTPFEIIAVATAIALFAYLIFALLYPESFV